MTVPDPLEPTDPTEQSGWRPLRLLLAAMDADIARIYAEAQITGLTPSMVLELLRLHARRPRPPRALQHSTPRPQDGHRALRLKSSGCTPPCDAPRSACMCSA